jgi:hypothetical protein
MECESCKEKDAYIAELESAVEHTTIYHREYMRKRLNRIRAEAIEQRGGKCERCGSTDHLKFKYIKQNNKDVRVSQLWSLAREYLEAQLLRCELLCDSCAKNKKHLEAERRQKATLRRRELAYKKLYPDE